VLSAKLARSESGGVVHHLTSEFASLGQRNVGTTGELGIDGLKVSKSYLALVEQARG